MAEAGRALEALAELERHFDGPIRNRYAASPSLDRWTACA